MRRILVSIVGPLAIALVALFPSAAAAAVGDELLANPSFEVAAGSGPASWTQSTWGKNASAFTWQASGHAGARSARVDVSSYTNGDSKWMPDLIPVKGGSYYVFSDWYKANANTAVSVYYETATDPVGKEAGTWANLFSGIAPADDWTQYKTGFTMPANAVRAAFVHFIARKGYLQTDDYSVKEQAAAPGFSRPMISLSFDDGSQGFYDVARPLLDAHGFKTTQYVPTYGLTTSPQDSFMMTPGEIRTLAAAGHEIGSHSITHPDLTTVSASQLTRELVDSKSLLEGIIEAPITSFAYPFGSYDAHVIDALKTAGYTNARSVEDGYNSTLDLERYDLRGQNILSTTTNAQFQSWIEYAKAHNYWLIVIYHEVQPDGTPRCSVRPNADPCVGDYDTTVSRFKAQLAAIAAAGLAPNVMTVGQAYALATGSVPPPPPPPPTQHAPTAGRVAITPSAPTTAATITASPSGFSDPDGDALTYHYEWRVNGAVIAGATARTFSLATAGQGDHGDRVTVDVYATDPAGNSSASVSASATVANTAPTAGTVSLSPTRARAGQALTATPQAFRDADGDRLSYTYAWSRNGRVLANQTSATLPASAVRANASIRVEVRAADGQGGISAAAAATTTVRR